MNTDDESCTVALTKQCKSASNPNDATTPATSNATLDLLALSATVLARNKSNYQCNSHATKQGTVLSPTPERNCIVAPLSPCNSATDELKRLIIQVSQNNGGDDEKFLEDYIDDVLKEWSHDLDAALACFRDLARQEVPVNNRE